MEELDITTNKEEEKTLINKIEETEIKKAIDQLAKEKSPGIDGIPAEFYKEFKTKLALILTEIFNAILQEGKLTETQGKGIINLIYKKKEKKQIRAIGDQSHSFV